MMDERDRPTSDAKVVVTPEMRKVGAAALEEYRESDDGEILAEAVYIAMTEALIGSRAWHDR